MVDFVLSHDEMITLIKKCREQGGRWFVDSVVFAMQFFLMRRISEVLKLQIPHILFHREEIIFYRTKTGDIQLRCPIWILSDLKEIIGDREIGYVFENRAFTIRKNRGTHLSRHTLNYDLKKACEKHLGIKSFQGYKVVKQCFLCPGKSGNLCEYNNMKWCQLVSTKKCEREGRPMKKIEHNLIHTHILRASGATALIEQGYSERQVMSWGGWRDQNAFRRYVVQRRDLNLLLAWEEMDKGNGFPWQKGQKVLGEVGLYG